MDAVAGHLGYAALFIAWMRLRGRVVLRTILGIAAGISLLGAAALGVALLAYAAVLFMMTNGETVARRNGVAVVVMNVVYVIGSAILLLAGWEQLTVAGRWLVALQAEAVAFFAVWQWYGLRR